MAEELDRERPLFNDEVAVQVKLPENVCKTLALTVRVLQGSRLAPVGSGGGQREGVLHIEVTDELDPFFLYTLQVGEDDYHQLKHDQCLRVDFKSFPRKFIELLESCRASSGAAAVDPESRNGYTPGEEGGGRPSRGEPLLPSSGEPSFLARLETVVPGGFSLFSVVETNPFKELTHLSLKFRVGNDASIKTYLAARLRQLKAEVSVTSSTLEDTRTALAREGDTRARLDSEVSALRLDRERDLRDLRAAHSAELTAAREEGVRRAEEAAAARSAEMGALRRKAEEDVAQVSQRLRQSEQRREELTDLKFAHEAELRELRGRSEAGEAGREAATSDAKALREANRALEARAFEAEREADRLRLHGAALAQQVADAKEMADKSQALQAASAASVARLEETQEAYKGSVVALQERLEASVHEINRGNAIIQKLQGQYRALRSKAKLKSEVIKQQERLLSEHEASISAGESKLKAAAAELRAAEASRESLQRELAASEGRLEESARLLASNQQVIKWLNKELNDAQMVPGGITTAAAAAVAEAGAAYGGRAAASSPLPPLGEYSFGGVDASPRSGGVGGNGRGGGVKDMMFTTGIRESLTGGGGVSWNLRGTTLDDDGGGGGGGGGVGDGNQTGGYSSYGGEETGRGTATPKRGVESTPDHGGRGVGRRSYTRIVTPESGGVSDPMQASSRFLVGAGAGAGAEAATPTPGNMMKEGLYEEGSERDNELAGGAVGGDAIRGIRAY
ncbi:unnamed protein product [Ectocarpus sp. CCAP 1310/34]|nr:unnamed protein product [Ectocarpus sp. CCAP 1310/34]